MSQKLYSIRCTNCNAPLDLLGGGRVSTITCKYCKSVLDLNDKYKVLGQYQERDRPDSQLQIGMRGFVRGIEWIIIGMIEHVGSDAYERRLDFFLYSKLYGYAWLTEEDGALYFAKRARDFSVYEWEAKGKPTTTFYDHGHYMQKESPYFMSVSYVEGELSWVAKMGDVAEYTDFYGANQKSLTIERTQKEIEIYHTQRLHKDMIIKSFSLTDKEGKNLQQNNPESEVYEKFPSYLRMGTLVMALLLGAMVVLSLLFGDVVYKSSKSNSVVKQNIIIKHSDFLGKISIKANNSTNLSNFAMRITAKKSGKIYFSINKKQVYFTKQSLGHTWQSRDDRVDVYLKLDKGEYLLEANVPPGTSLMIEEEVVRLYYVFPLLILVMMLLFYLYSDERFGSMIKYGIIAIVIASIFIFNMPFELIIFIMFILFIFFGSGARGRSSGGSIVYYNSWGDDWGVYDD